MGIFGGGSDDSDKQQDEVISLQRQQMDQNAQELQAKKQNLYDTRLAILKGQGGQSWVPNK